MTRAGTVVWLLAMGVPAGLVAQVTASSPYDHVLALQAAYEEAKVNHDAARLAADRLQREWNRMLEEHAAASQSGDKGRVRELLAQFQERSGPKNRAENAWRKSQEAWIAAGQAVISAIDGYLDILWEAMQRSVGGAEDSALYNGLERELRMVEQELPEEPLELEPMPEVELRPQDTPREIQYKVRVIENRVAFYERLLAELDRDIASLTKRKRREQNRRDSQGARERFGDGTVPTGDQRRHRIDGAVVVILEPIEVRIEKKKTLRGEIESRMIELERKAEKFEETGGAS